jgi:hypothetical protein
MKSKTIALVLGLVLLAGCWDPYWGGHGGGHWHGGGGGWGHHGR